MSIDLKKLENKLDEALSNETSETLTKFLKDKTMSNNKQSMKLYTETEILSLLKIHLADEEQADSFVALLTPIELPSDEEIEAHVEDDFINAIEIHKYSEEAQLLMKAMCKAGALWMRDKIQGGNK